MLRRRRTAVGASLEGFVPLCDAAFASRLAAHGFSPDAEEPLHDASGASRAYRNGDRYVRVHATTDYRDGDATVSVDVGEGSTEWPDADWNAIAVGQLAGPHGWHLPIPSIDELPAVLGAAAVRLEAEAADFLGGDVTRLRRRRAEIVRSREPYSIHRPDRTGRYTSSVDPESRALKERYSQED